MKKIIAIFAMLIIGSPMSANLIQPAFMGPAQTGFPRPVTVVGSQITAAECLQVVNSAIWTQCALRNNCIGLSLIDIRPSIIMDLNNRGQNNFAVQCQGFIDEAFRAFQAQTPRVTQTSFPTTQNMGAGGFPTVTPRTEHEARSIELAQMQMMNAHNMPMGLAPASMPTTFEDLSFIDRWEIQQEGWQHEAANQRRLYMQTQRGGMNIEHDVARRARESQRLADDAAYDAALHTEQMAQLTRARKEETERLFDLRNRSPDDWRAWCENSPTDCRQAEMARARSENMGREEFCRRFWEADECRPTGSQLSPAQIEMQELQDRARLNELRARAESTDPEIRRQAEADAQAALEDSVRGVTESLRELLRGGGGGL